MVAKWFDHNQSEEADRYSWPRASLGEQILRAGLSTSLPARACRERRVTLTAPAPSPGARRQDRQPARASARNRSLQGQRESAIAKLVARQNVTHTDAR